MRSARSSPPLLRLRGLAIRALVLPAALGIFLGTGHARAAASRVPLVPAEAATVGPRPVFRFSAPSGWVTEGGAIIELSRDHWKSIERAWDIRISRRGWETPPEPLDRNGAFRCMESLPEGAWEWRVRASEGTIDADAPRVLSFMVDATPPAEIEGLRLQHRDDGSILLSWEPVIYDVDGKPETVAHYVVYRYRVRGIFRQVPPMEIGRTKAPSFLDPHPSPGSSGPASPARTISPREAPAAPPRAQSDLGSEQPTGQAKGKDRAPVSQTGNESTGGSPPGGGRTETRAAPQASGKARAALGRDSGEDRSAGFPIYYKVVAVDLAGNELGIRDLQQDDDRPSRPPPRGKPADLPPPAGRP